MEEVISVIVPVYNGARYIQKCVESIQKNTYQNLEIIIVNDGSKDNSLELLNELARRDERIQVYSKENGGIASAREFGLQKATGKYLCFVDQDDIVYSNAYETLKNNMEHFNSDLCIASFHCLRGKKKQLFSATQTNKVIERNEVEKYLFQIGNCIMHTNYHFDHQMYLISVWNCMYKREIVEKNHIHFQSFYSCEDDSLFNFDYMMHAQSISFEKTPIYGWIQNIRSFSHNTRYIENFYQKRYQFFQYIIGQIKQIHLEDFHIEEKTWERLFLERNFVETVVNEAQIKDRSLYQERISYLEELYQKLIEKGYDFSELEIPKIRREPFYDTWRYCMNGKIKKAYRMNYFWYNKIVLPLLHVLKKIYYAI